jgi:hypothetical protein
VGNLDHDPASFVFLAGSTALRTGVGDNFPITVASTTGGSIDEASEDALLDTPHLSASVAVGACGWSATRLAAATAAPRASLGTVNIYLFITAPGCFFKGDIEITMEVSSLLCPPPRCRHSLTEEGIKNTSPSPKAFEILEFSAEKFVGSPMPKAIVAGSFLRAAEHFISLVDFLELFRCSSFTIMIWMVAESQLSEGSLDLLFAGVFIQL